MRFEVRAAFAIGVLLPFLETCRRGLGHWLVDFMTMFEDYAAGFLLVFAGAAAVWGWRTAGLWLVAVWSGVAALMSISFFSQLEVTIRGTDMEPNNLVVILFKFLLWATSMTALFSSFRRAAERGA